ncbi:MAG: YfhO family protein [Anaerolineae bacterium]
MTPSTRSYVRTFAPLILLIGLILAAYAHLAFTDRILARGDTFTYFYPYWEARSAAFRVGTLPLWSPDLFMGVPLLANSQLGTFYPPNWAVTPFSAPDAIKISVIAHVLWAGIGAYVLARRGLRISRAAALTSGLIFALGGVIGAHVEQINQLQGLSWMGWLFWCLHESTYGSARRRRLFTLMLAAGIAMQFLSGHTQTVFITGLGLGIDALLRNRAGRWRALASLVGAGLLALLLVLPQLIPTLELTRTSNRAGGLTQNEATAFSFSPFVAGRGLLPSDDRSIFTEYVAYIGVIGIGLALVGLFSDMRSAPDQADDTRSARRWVWAMLAIVGLLFAFGAYNPLYWLIARLPGFNLFRVPARWLALFALGAALLAGIGLHALQHGAKPRWRVIGLFALIITALAISTRLITANPDNTPISLPEPITIAGWITAAGVFIILCAGANRMRLLRWAWLPLLIGLSIELIAANRALPHAQTVPAEAWGAQRFTISQLRAYAADQTPPGRMLSISQTLFDPGDHAALEARYTALGMSADAIRSALVAVKLKEIVAPNLPLAWGIPSIDGYDGGVLPTRWYTAFTSLLLPANTESVDGRLRELLAREDCGGACIPDQRWLDLTNTRYLIVDKVYDLWSEGVAYDTALPQHLIEGTAAVYTNPQGFAADRIDIAYIPDDEGSSALLLHVDGVNTAPNAASIGTSSDPIRLVQFPLPAAAVLDPMRIVGSNEGVTVLAVTLVNTADGTFQQLAPQPFTRVLSSDIKIYENTSMLPRAYVVYTRQFFSDDSAGDQALLEAMRQPEADPRSVAYLSTAENEGLRDIQAASTVPVINVDHYTANEVQISIRDNAEAGLLILTDAYYPGWTAVVNEQPAPIYRADMMFRAVPVPAGDSTITFRYSPSGLSAALLLGGAAWLGLLLGGLLTLRPYRRSLS